MLPAHPYATTVHTESRQATVERMLEVYRITIEANSIGDKETVAHGLALLKRTLDPQADLLLARQLSELYTIAETASRENNPEITAEILETLRGQWIARRRLDKIRK
ncbi:MAG: hypothetical protein LAT55_00620 [Opitutales bacterium]|nr:hypothetical protein [Opitutales bacterium]